MYIIRDSFTAKPGQASKLAALFKEAVPELTGQAVRVVTDAVGQYNTVEMEMEVEDLSAFEKRQQEYSENPEFRERMAGYTELYLTGRRTILRVI
jgi:hypothetical protein